MLKSAFKSLTTVAYISKFSKVFERVLRDKNQPLALILYWQYDYRVSAGDKIRKSILFSEFKLRTFTVTQSFFVGRYRCRLSLDPPTPNAGRDDASRRVTRLRALADAGRDDGDRGRLTLRRTHDESPPPRNPIVPTPCSTRRRTRHRPYNGIVRDDVYKPNNMCRVVLRRRR